MRFFQNPFKFSTPVDEKNFRLILYFQEDEGTGLVCDGMLTRVVVGSPHCVEPIAWLTDVPQYVDWIRSEMKKRKDCPRSGSEGIVKSVDAKNSTKSDKKSDEKKGGGDQSKASEQPKNMFTVLFSTLIFYCGTRFIC